MSKSTSSKASRAPDEKRLKEEATKRREELKTLLMTKFEGKYRSKKVPSQIIQEEVERFLDTMTLTAENLQILDDRILEAAKIVKPGSARSSTKSTGKREETKKVAAKKGPTVVKKEVDDIDDRLSVMSGATDIVERKPANQKQYLDTKTRLVKGEETPLERPKTEEDEWAAIVKFNSTLYQEELKQEQVNKAKQKRYMKDELEKQVKEKKYIKEQNKAEEDAYIEYHKRHLQEMEALEKQKQEEKKRQIQLEKTSREKQKKEDLLRKKIEMREDKKRDKELIERMKKELELEKKADKDKKIMEKETMKKMMTESMKLKEEQKDYMKKEREEDIKLQEQQQRLLDMQEADRVNELMKKDERNRKLMEAAQKQKGDKGSKGVGGSSEEMVNNQVKLLEDKRKDEEEKRERFRKEKQREVKEMLDKQVQERKQRKVQDKLQSQQQAEMWKKELDLHYEQEQKNNQKVKEVHKKHQDYLLQQMEIAKKGKPSNAMSEKEYLLNKELLEKVNKKLDNDAASIKSGSHY